MRNPVVASLGAWFAERKSILMDLALIHDLFAAAVTIDPHAWPRDNFLNRGI
jgi:hypothetical protein